jgi:myo-inositol-1(or 4)-monophosphatase
MSESPARLESAKQAASEAAAMVRAYAADLGRLRVEEKGVQDFVTQADREVEARIRSLLSAAHPEDGFVGEETGRTDGAPGSGHWVVDPIDGTANFMRGIPLYGVSLAYVREARVEVGVIADVARSQTFWAARGQGAYLDDQRLQVSTVDRLERSALCLGFWTRGGGPAFVRTLDRAVQARCDVRRIGAATMGLAFTAAGRFEAFFQSHINSWDIAAGLLLVEEAGGWTSPFFERGGLDHPLPFAAGAPGVREAVRALVEL